MMTDREMYNKSIEILINLTQEGPVSQWVDRLGLLIKGFDETKLQDINWFGSPVQVCDDIVDVFKMNGKANELLMFLQKMEVKQ